MICAYCEEPILSGEATQSDNSGEILHADCAEDVADD
jgi:predicted nucleic acid-binding Zn ribbon protein